MKTTLSPLPALLASLIACGGDTFQPAPSPPQAVEPLAESAPPQLFLLHPCGGGSCLAARRADSPTLLCPDGLRRPSCEVSGVLWPEHIDPASLPLAPRGHERLAALARWTPDGALDVVQVHTRAGEGELGSPRLARSEGCTAEGCAPLEVTLLGRQGRQIDPWLDLSRAPGDDRSRNLWLAHARSPEGALLTGQIKGSGARRRLEVHDYFVPRPRPLCGQELAARLAEASAGLLWPSESDEPIAPLVAPDTPLDEASLRSLAGLAPDAPLDDRGMAPFAWLCRDDPSMQAAERAQAARFRALRAALDENLDEVSARFIGEISVRVLIVGRSRCGELAGFSTSATET